MNKSLNRDLLSYRKTQEVNFIQLDSITENAQEIRINFDNDVLKKTLDVGSLAYCKRGEIPKNSGDKRCLPVVESSLVAGRPELLLKIFEYLSQYSNHRTVVSIFTSIRQIFDWCDSNGYIDVFMEDKATSNIYRAYSDQLYHLVQNGSYNPLTAHKLQRIFCRIIEIAFPENHLHISSSATAIKAQRRNSGAPSESWVLNYIGCTLSIARGLSKALVEKSAFPWTINFQSFDAVLFPSNAGVYTPYTRRSSSLYNVEERRLATLQEYMHSVGSEKVVLDRHLKYAWRAGVENLERANCEGLAGYRLIYATLALKAYACLIVAVTGCYPSELIQFDYEEAIQLEKSLVKKELSAVKIRARGRKTKYALGKEGGLIILKEFMELRAWMLRGQKYDRLFFGLKQCRSSQVFEMLPLSPSFTSQFYNRISGLFLDPSVPHLGGRLLRRHKTVILKTLGTPPKVVAELLNHSLATSESDYSSASTEQQSKELNLFWKAIRKASNVVRDRGAEELLSIAAGHCQGFDKPHLVISDAGIVPDCQTQLGCLYCDKYVCHADEEDVHKLLSLSYVVQAVRRSSPDPKHSEAVFHSLSIRINYILKEVAGRSRECEELVLLMTDRVNNLGELTYFWESRLQRYEQLGVVF